MFPESRFDNLYLKNRISDFLGTAFNESVVFGGAAVEKGTSKVCGCKFGVVGAMLQ